MKLPTYTELKDILQITPDQSAFVQQSRQTIKNILNADDKRLLMIVGPCSIHDAVSAKEFAIQLKSLAPVIANQFFIVMRVYCEKPRTVSGWKGFLYDPFLDGSNQIRSGITRTRELLLDLADLGVAAATEFLDPLTTHYYEDLISWGSIGARTSSSQTHRQLASSLSMAIGIKNGIAGNVSSAIGGVIASSNPHTFIGIDSEGVKSILNSNGNQDTHIVLRGGESGPNYHPESIREAMEKLEEVKLPIRLIVDCSHHNSNKRPLEQVTVFKNVLQQVIEGNQCIRGFMIESHLHSDNQILTEDPKQLKYGVSITDPCLDWDMTKQLLIWASQFLAQKPLLNSTLQNFDTPFGEKLPTAK